MREESQIEEMRAAVRGERERAEQGRRRSLEIVSEPSVAAAPAPEREERGRRRLRSFFRRC